MSFIFTYLSQAKLALVIAAGVILLTLVGSTWYYKTSYEETLVELSRQVESSAQMESALKACSDSIHALAVTTADKLKKAEDASKLASIEFAKHRRIADNILISQPKGKTLCESSEMLLKQYVEEKTK